MLRCLNGGGTSITTSTLRVLPWPVCSGAARLPNPDLSPRIPRSSAGTVRARLWCDGVRGAIVVTCGAATRPPARRLHRPRSRRPAVRVLDRSQSGPRTRLGARHAEADGIPDEDARRATDRAHLGPRHGRDEELVERGRVGTW